MKLITKLLLISALLVPGLLLAETAEVIPWNLDPDEGEEEPGGEATVTDENSSEESDQTGKQSKEEDKDTNEESDQDDESEEGYDFDIKINKDYPDSYFYPGPRQRNDPSFGIPGK